MNRDAPSFHYRLSLGTASHIDEILKIDEPNGIFIKGENPHSRIDGLNHQVQEATKAAKSLESSNSRLQQQLASSESQLSSLLVECGILRQALDLDIAMAPRHGPILLSSKCALDNFYHKCDFQLLKRERDRNLSSMRTFEKMMAEAEVREACLVAELKAMDKNHAAQILAIEKAHAEIVAVKDKEIKDAKEIIDTLRLKKGSIKLCDGEKKTVEGCFETALGPRPWFEKSNAPRGQTFGWTFEEWLEAFDLHKILAKPFNKMLRYDEGCPRKLIVNNLLPEDDAANRRAFLHALGTNGSRETILAMLRSTPLLEELTTAIWKGVERFTKSLDMVAAGIARRKEKFDGPVTLEDAKDNADSKLRQLTYGPTRKYYDSLRQLVGSPGTDGLAAMAREHVAADDSDLDFIAPNYNIKTTSRLEWYIVADEKKALVELELDDWPEGGRHTPNELGFRFVASPTSEYFSTRIDAVNERLLAAGDKEKLSLEHFCALRMYTGPIYMKYNFILRGADESLTNDFIKKYLTENCRGNSYPTTMLYLCLGISKLSLISKAEPVYRAPGGRMPKEFFTKTADGTRGGVEVRRHLHIHRTWSAVNAVNFLLSCDPSSLAHVSPTLQPACRSSGACPPQRKRKKPKSMLLTQGRP